MPSIKAKPSCRASIVHEGREEVFGEDALATVELDFYQFCLAVSHSSMLISKTFKGQLVIPEFEEFCRQSRKIVFNLPFLQEHLRDI